MCAHIQYIQGESGASVVDAVAWWHGYTTNFKRVSSMANVLMQTSCKKVNLKKTMCVKNRQNKSVEEQKLRKKNSKYVFVRLGKDYYLPLLWCEIHVQLTPIKCKPLRSIHIISFCRSVQTGLIVDFPILSTKYLWIGVLSRVSSMRRGFKFWFKLKLSY